MFHYKHLPSSDELHPLSHAFLFSLSPPGRIRNNFLTNLLTHSCLYCNTGSPICFVQCYSQRHKKVHSQGQPIPLHKSLKSENLECNSSSHTKSLEASSTKRYKGHSCFDTSHTKEKKRELSQSFSYS